MWGPLLVLALLTTINPVRIGLILLMLSRPRPMQNLLAYWTGALIVGLATLLIPLFVLHLTSADFMKDFAHPSENPTAQRITIGTGVLLLSVAALMTVRSVVRAPGVAGRHRTPHPNGDGNTSTLVLDSTTPSLISRLVQPRHGAAEEGGSPFRRMLGRFHNAWQNGSPSIAFVLGIIVIPPLDGVLFGLAIIVTSGTSIEVQVAAVIAYMIGVLAIEEIILVSNVVAPSRTQAALRRLHELARVHKREFVAAILTVVGLSLLLRGMAGL